MEDKLNTIEKYLQGTLKGEELSSFEKAMKSNAELSEEIKLHRLMAKAVADKNGDELFAKNLKTIGDEYLRQAPKETFASTKSIRLRVIKWGIAASFALIIAMASWFYWNSTAVMSGGELFAQEFEIPLLTDRQRSSGEAINIILDRAYSSFEEKEFDQAAVDFEAALAQEDLPSLRYYQAVSYLASSPPDTQKAIKAFQIIIEDGNNSFVPAAKWYLALSHLQSEKKTEAETLLIQLSKTPSKYQQKAKDLLKQL